MKKLLKSHFGPQPIGPYSPAVEFNELIFTSGQIALDVNGNIKGDDIRSQTTTVLQNLVHLLEDNRSSMNNVLKTTVYLKSMDDFAIMNEVYDHYFCESLPARTTVEVSRLPKDVLVEIDVIAFKNKKPIFGNK